MRQFVTASRVRSVIADAITEADVIDSLRRHGIRYEYSTETGYLHIRIPCRTGCLRVYRQVYRVPQNRLRSAPFRSGFSAPAVPGSAPLRSPFRVPVLHNDD